MKRTLAMAVFFLTVSQPAFAIFNGQLIVGSRGGMVSYAENGEQKMGPIRSTEMGAALHFDPIPAVPVSFGLALYSNNYDTSEIAEKTMTTPTGVQNASVKGSISGLSYGPEIMAWLPKGSWEPFLRVGYLMGTKKDEVTVGYDLPVAAGASLAVESKTELNYETKGPEYGIGCRWKFTPLFGVFIEYMAAAENMKWKSGKATTTGGSVAVAGGTASVQDTSRDIEADELTDQQKNRLLATAAFRLGLQVGF